MSIPNAGPFRAKVCRTRQTACNNMIVFMTTFFVRSIQKLKQICNCIAYIMVD